MPYYKDFPDKKTRGDKRRSAEARGGFEDEGSRYGGKRPHGERGPRAEGGRTGGQGPRREGDFRYAPGGQQPYNRRGADVSPRPYNELRHEGRGMPPRPDRRGPMPPPDGEPRRDAPPPPRPRPGRRGPDAPPPPKPRPDRPDRRGPEAPPRPRPGRREETPRRGYDAFRYDSPENPPRAAYDSPERPPRATYDSPEREDAESVADGSLLSGRNPLREALKSGRDLEKLLVARGDLSGSAREIVAMAKERRVPVQEVDRARLDAITPNHQGMLAFASAYQYHTVEEMLALAKERGEAPFLVVLDGITDPHNLGAIIRTAECAGAHGVIVQERRAVGLTPAAVKASAGAIEHMMVARVTNLVSTLETLKQQNIWIYAADQDGEDYATVDFKGGVAIVIGAEGEGIGRLVLQKCDKRVALPIRGKLDSLNASVAAGILLYAVLRGR
jgi:23S rRNA (guanosine2251-2'-O)-methyltransferase